MKKLGTWILHPFLFGFYPILALLAHNVMQVSLYSALRPLLFSLLLAGLLWGLFSLLMKDRYRAALAASLTLFLVFSYGHIYNLIEDIHLGGINVGRHRFLAPLLLVVYLISVWAIGRRFKPNPVVPRSLNLVGICLLIYPLVQIVSYGARAKDLPQPAGSDANQISLAASFHLPTDEAPPDIYYIILDMYTRGDALQQVFNYDNSTFLSALEQRGFYIAHCSQSNYSYTAASFTSFLNMQYLDTLSSQFAPPNTDISILEPFLQRSVVRQVLEDFRYKTVAFQTGYSMTELRDADYYLSPQSGSMKEYFLGGLTPFEALLFQTTIGDFLFAVHAFPSGMENSLFNYAYLIFRNRILYEFDQLGKVPTLPSPKFVFVHIIAPHNPFVFTASGDFVSRTTPFTLNNDIDALRLPDYKRGYADQVAYINTRILEVVDALLVNSATPPVIILQGDHGSPRVAGWETAILNAYYLPDASGMAMLYPSISPVNSFRVIFNAYFGANLPLLPDTSYRSDVVDQFSTTVQSDPNSACATP